MEERQAVCRFMSQQKRLITERSCALGGVGESLRHVETMNANGTVLPSIRCGHRICYARGWGDVNQIYMLLKGSHVPISQQEHPVIHIQEHTTHDQKDHPTSYQSISLDLMAISADG